MKRHYIHASKLETKDFIMTLEKKLRAFFMKNDPGRVRLAPKMALKFRGKDKAILAHLTKVYSKGGVDAIIAKGVAVKETKRLEEIAKTAAPDVDEVLDSGSAVEQTEEEIAASIENVEDLIDDLDD